MAEPQERNNRRPLHPTNRRDNTKFRAIPISAEPMWNRTCRPIPTRPDQTIGQPRATLIPIPGRLEPTIPIVDWGFHGLKEALHPGGRTRHQRQPGRRILAGTEVHGCRQGRVHQRPHHPDRRHPRRPQSLFGPAGGCATELQSWRM